MRRQKSWWPVSVLAASLQLAMSACTGSDGGPPPKPAAIPAPETVALTRDTTQEETEVLYRAEQMRIRDCMRRQGFDYFLVPRRPVPEMRDFPYVVDDVSWAAKYGYGSTLYRLNELALEKDPNERYFESLPATRRAQALLARNGDARNGDLLVDVPGIPNTVTSSKGCRAAAQRELYGDLPAWVRADAVMTALVPLRQGAVTADPRFVKAVQRWSRCMRERGHPYASPAQARDNVPRLVRHVGPEQSGPADAPAAETALAVAEATCANRTGLAATARQVDQEHAARLRAQYRADVAAGQRLQQQALPGARAIVAAG
ncbi:hypothetical protein EDD30_3178 [Couchioplanes caeruleus]|uniref:Lipoprotein n=3 Tax=Couchioplanes caeruleus TaxID=56438 RepID=A0A1K0FN44_9ACTN|nr:hypothetical protein BG844_10750 [Couchioplanes caeruleus subsp. caeruleus]ROP30335.1 hypothetical protein EDD30_3178 [Couchioplanes caeruleus]